MSARSATDDLKPLPHRVQWWRKSRERRQAAYKSFKSAVARALTLAISVVGGTLISYGVWMIYAPLGWITGGFVVWLLLWSHEQDKRRSG